MTNCLPSKVYATPGNLFRQWQSVISHSYKVDYSFITSNILHSAIIIWSSSNLTTDTKWWPIFNKFCQSREAHKGISIGVFSGTVDKTMRPNVQRLIERNVKCHVMFFRLITFKISIWVCNKTLYQRTLLGTSAN